MLCDLIHIFHITGAGIILRKFFGIPQLAKLETNLFLCAKWKLMLWNLSLAQENMLITH